MTDVISEPTNPQENNFDPAVYTKEALAGLGRKNPKEKGAQLQEEDASPDSFNCFLLMIDGDPGFRLKGKSARRGVVKAIFTSAGWVYEKRDEAEEVAQRFTVGKRKVKVTPWINHLVNDVWSGSKSAASIAREKIRQELDRDKCNKLKNKIDSQCDADGLDHSWLYSDRKNLSEDLSEKEKGVYDRYKPQWDAAREKEETLALREHDLKCEEADDKQISTSTPVILVEPGKVSEAVDAAEKLILQNDIGIYQRGGQLVRMVKSDRSKSNLIIRRDLENPVIIEIEPYYLTEKLTQKGYWITYDKRQKDNKRIDCPIKISQMLLARREWEIPDLHGIIQAPTLRPNGSILETPGYDEATGLFFHTGGCPFPDIPLNPTKDDAQKALKILKKLLKDFPFESSEERSDGKSESFSVALSAILTALIRRSIGTAPLHGFSSPKMATGKSLLADIVSLIATGKEMTAISQSENEAEEKKRLLSVLMEGDSIICYDNIEEVFGSAALCSVLTQLQYKDRVLGASKSASVPTNATFLATGNNLTFIGDISTRVVLCRLNADVERPEEREFDVNLRSYIPSHRGSLVQAGLTILKAYKVAGRPKQNIRPFGRFEEWSDWVRSAIVWLGEADPCDSRKEIEETDPVRVSLIRLLMVWYETFDNSSQTAKNVIKKAQEKDLEELSDVLLEIAPNKRGDGVCPRRLGNKLASFNKRIEGGYRLEKAGIMSRAILWRVKKV